MDDMNIVLATDEGYIVPTMVALSSLLASNRGCPRILVHILCPKGFSQVGRSRILGVGERYGRPVTFLEIDDPRVDAAVTTAHITAASYYRLYMSRLIPADRCLYIDGDMIVAQDLTGVYGIGLEGCYAAGVRDMGIQYHYPEWEAYAGYLGIPDMRDYVNAGFLVLNLEQIRKDGMDRRMIESISMGYMYMDQDIMNKLFYGKMRMLPEKYDLFTEYYGGVDGSDGREVAVYHFVGPFKPWLCTRLAVDRIWWDEAERILDPELYGHTLERARAAERESDWEHIADAARDREHIVVFGCSRIGSEVAADLARDRKGRTIVFADNDTGKIGKTVEGIRVISAEEACSAYPDALYVISSQNGFRQIRAQLARLGVGREDIVRYVHKDEAYYRGLDGRFKEHEERQMRLRGRR